MDILDNVKRLKLDICVDAIVEGDRTRPPHRPWWSSCTFTELGEGGFANQAATYLAYLERRVAFQTGGRWTVRQADPALFFSLGQPPFLTLVHCPSTQPRVVVTERLVTHTLISIAPIYNGLRVGASWAPPAMAKEFRQRVAAGQESWTDLYEVPPFDDEAFTRFRLKLERTLHRIVSSSNKQDLRQELAQAMQHGVPLQPTLSLQQLISFTERAGSSLDELLSLSRRTR